MFFGGFSGGVALHPESVVDTPYVPPVRFTDFRLFGIPVKIGAGSPLVKSIAYTNSLSLSHDDRSFSLEFAALSYFNSRANRYRYKLEGLDSQWHEVDSNQRPRYLHHASGRDLHSSRTGCDHAKRLE